MGDSWFDRMLWAEQNTEPTPPPTGGIDVEQPETPSWGNFQRWDHAQTEAWQAQQVSMQPQRGEGWPDESWRNRQRPWYEPSWQDYIQQKETDESWRATRRPGYRDALAEYGADESSRGRWRPGVAQSWQDWYDQLHQANQVTANAGAPVQPHEPLPHADDWWKVVGAAEQADNKFANMGQGWGTHRPQDDYTFLRDTTGRLRAIPKQKPGDALGIMIAANEAARKVPGVARTEDMLAWLLDASRYMPTSMAAGELHRTGDIQQQAWQSLSPADQTALNRGRGGGVAYVQSDEYQIARAHYNAKLAELEAELAQRYAGWEGLRERLTEDVKLHEERTPLPVQIALGFVDPVNYLSGAALAKGANVAVRGVSTVGPAAARFPVLVANARKLQATAAALRKTGMVPEAAELEQAVKTAGFSSREASVLLRDAANLAASVPDLRMRAMDLNAVENLREDLAMVKPKEYMGGWSRTLSEIIGREVKRPRDLTNSELSMLRDELDTRARQLLEGAQRTSTETKAFRDTMSWMHEEAVPFRRATYSRENWRAEFGKDLTVQTPIGEIKVGEHQADKLESMMRERYFGLIKPTLQDPLFVFGEPGGKMVFVKTFIEKDVTHFASVAVDKYGLRIVISNHPLQNKELRGYLSEGRVLYDKRIRARQ